MDYSLHFCYVDFRASYCYFFGHTYVVEVCPPVNGGLLVLFPSWLMHEVVPMPDSYKGPRIGISFNVNHAAYRGSSTADKVGAA
jgi:Putative 2OG-Fe(II) oxygenase